MQALTEQQKTTTSKALNKKAKRVTLLLPAEARAAILEDDHVSGDTNNNVQHVMPSFAATTNRVEETLTLPDIFDVYSSFLTLQDMISLGGTNSTLQKLVHVELVADNNNNYTKKKWNCQACNGPILAPDSTTTSTTFAAGQCVECEKRVCMKCLRNDHDNNTNIKKRKFAQCRPCFKTNTNSEKKKTIVVHYFFCNDTTTRQSSSYCSCINKDTMKPKEGRGLARCSSCKTRTICLENDSCTTTNNHRHSAAALVCSCCGRATCGPCTPPFRRRTCQICHQSMCYLCVKDLGCGTRPEGQRGTTNRCYSCRHFTTTATTTKKRTRTADLLLPSAVTIAATKKRTDLLVCGYRFALS